MNNKIIILAIVLSTLMITSCVKDLDVKPKDPNNILAANLSDDPAYMKEALGKIYASFIINGQGSANNDHGNGPDISAGDNDKYTTSRALWNLQELTTDEAICAWTDPGIPELNTQSWNSSNLYLTPLYQRLSLSITYANDFIKLTKGNNDPAIIQYNAEARFLRALAYYWHMDLFANPPFTTDEDGVGKFFPKQLDQDSKIGRAKLFNYIVSELHSIEDLLGEPKFSYPQADKAACWMLLARIYLNAEVYTGTAKWDSCKIYCDKVINSGKYSLATNYRQNFSADNDGNHNPEMIYALEQDGVNTQVNGGSSFIIHSCSDGTHIDAGSRHDLPNNANWSGNRTKKQFLNVLVDTLFTYGNNPVPAGDTIFAQCKDKRVYCQRMNNWDIPSPTSDIQNGIGVWKFTGFNSDGSRAANWNSTFASTDFPIFRYADALLMRAEALHKLGDDANAVIDINSVRERAYGNATGNITTAELTDQFILDERGREFYYEAQRRTDLVRFGKFTDGNYNWAWKGGTINGTNTDSHLNIFPIPGDEVTSNPNITQNPNY